MNRYTKNISKIEFVVCEACTGNCRHCSEGEHIGKTNQLDPVKSAAVVIDVCRKYEVKTGIMRHDEIGQLARTIDFLTNKLL